MKKRMISSLLVITLLAGTCLVGCGSDVKTQDAAQSEETSENGETDQESAEDVDALEEGSNDYAVDKLDRTDEGYTLVWNDEFDGDSLDTTKWTCQHGNGRDYGIENWGNSEAEWYTDREENVKVEDGMLKIIALEEDYESKHYTSGRLRTMTDDNEVQFAITYGRVEAKIRITGGEGVWPAFWMLPVDASIYGEWAASGELDIMEAKGRLPGEIGGTAHYAATWPDNIYSNKNYYFPEGTDISDFHTYSIEWTPNYIKWYVDDNCYSTLEDWYSKGPGCRTNYTYPAPFDVPFYIILNLALGGTFDPEGTLTKRSFPAEMDVDFVRVYQKTDGYEADLIAADEKKDESVDNDVEKTSGKGGNMLYNGSFNQGEDRLAFWNLENMECVVSDVIINEDGSEDYSRKAKLTATDENARIYQTGLSITAGNRYGVKFSVAAISDTAVRVTVEGSDGTIYLDQGGELPEASGTRGLTCTFTPDKDDEVVFNVYATNGSVIELDDVILMQID